jgi:hypothetical protein
MCVAVAITATLLLVVCEMSLAETIQTKVEQERRERQFDDFVDFLEEEAPPTDRWLRPPWCLDLPLQPETELPSVILT